MVRIDSINDLTNLQTLQSDSPELEMFTRSLINLRQRLKLKNDSKATFLNLSIKVEERDKEERNPTVDKSGLNGQILQIANLLKFDKFLTYQIKSWEFILNRINGQTKKDIIVAAPTAFGKTEAAIPPLLKEALKSDGLVLILSPRIALIQDQMKRIGGYDFGNDNLKFGLQMTGIQPKLEWTIYNPSAQRNKKMGGFEPKDSIDFTRHFNYSFENDLMRVKYLNPNIDEAEFLLFKCICGGTFKSKIFIRTAGEAYKRNTNNSKFHSSSPWKCTKCGKELEISLSREDHSKIKPNILFTTINSIESVLSDPDTRVDIRERLFAVVLDEVHTYNSTLGSHASSIIRELKKLKDDIIFAGLSATIDAPEAFGEKLFGNEVEVFRPDPTLDVNRISGGEKFLFIEASNAQRDEFYSYSLKSQSFIQFMLLSQSSFIKGDEKTLAFMDSKDAVSLLTAQTEDAYNHKHLQNYRLDGLINGYNLFNGHPCKGLGIGCESNCFVFEQGECWAKLRESRNVTSPDNIKPLKVMAENLDAEQLINSNLIFSTSELELGIDLEGITHLIQYGATFSIFDYIQRKGRAGRRSGELPYFYFILGDKPDDYLYFSMGSNILSRTYMLPLEPGNPKINKLHSYLEDLYEKTEKRYNPPLQNGNNSEYYVLKFASAWQTLKDHAEQEFMSFLEDELKLNFASLSSMSDYPSFSKFKLDNDQKVKKAIKDYEEKLKNSLLDGLTPLQYIEREKEVIINAINDSSLTDNEKKVALNDLEQNFSQVLSDLDTSSQNNSDKINHQRKLISFLNKLNEDNLGTPLSTKASEVYHKITSFANQSLSQGQDNVRELFMKLRSLYELKICVNRTLNSEIIKYFLRSQYFYMLGTPTNSILPTNAVDLVFPPENFFNSSNAQFLLYMDSNGERSKSYDIKDSIYKYFPFRLNESGDKYKIVVLPTITKDGTNYMFSVSSVMDGVHFTNEKQNKSILFPKSLRYDQIELLDPTNNVVKFCPNCFRIYSKYASKCSECNSMLNNVRPYASPLTERTIDFREGKTKIPNVEFSNKSKVTISLIGVDLVLTTCSFDEDFGTYMPTRKQSEYTILADKPYGYSINTHAISFTIDKKKVEKYLNLYKAQNPKRNRFSYSDVLHTIAHLWVKTISVSIGISSEEFAYEVDEENSKVFVSEKTEGGAGFLSLFVEYLILSTKRVISDMERIVRCEENQKNASSNLRQQVYNELNSLYDQGFKLSSRSTLAKKISKNLNLGFGEVVENYPTCFDGCNYCVAIPFCELGDADQLEHVSRMVAEWYFEELIVKTGDKKEVAKLISEGGLLVDDESMQGGDFGVFFV